jgi:rhodanese-related sulfurtransferase
MSSATPQEISPEELRNRLDAGERLALLDVREPAERAICAVPHPIAELDIHLPMGQIVDQLEWLRASLANAQAPLVVYCHHGMRSLHAAHWLSRQELNPILNLTGGIDAYSLRADTSVPRY